MRREDRTTKMQVVWEGEEGVSGRRRRRVKVVGLLTFTLSNLTKGKW